MKKFLSVFQFALQIAQIAEVAVPLPGKGKEKLSFAIDAAQQCFETEEELRASWKDQGAFLGAVTKAVGTAVSLLNAAGVFKHGPVMAQGTAQ